MYILQNKVWYSVTGFKGLQTIVQMQMLLTVSDEDAGVHL